MQQFDRSDSTHQAHKVRRDNYARIKSERDRFACVVAAAESARHGGVCRYSTGSEVGVRWDRRHVCDGIVVTSKCGPLYGAWTGYRHERNLHVASSRLGSVECQSRTLPFQFVQCVSQSAASNEWRGARPKQACTLLRVCQLWGSDKDSSRWSQRESRCEMQIKRADGRGRALMVPFLSSG